MVDGQRTEEQGTWASRAQKHSEADHGCRVARGAWTGKTVKRPRQQPARPQYANYWAPLTHKRHTPPHPAQPRHTNHWAPRTRKRHQQEHRLQRPTERSDPTQHAKGRTGDRPGPHKETTTRRNVTQGGQGSFYQLSTAGGQSFSLVPVVPVSLAQEFSSAPIKPQHHLPPPPPPAPLDPPTNHHHAPPSGK